MEQEQKFYLTREKRSEQGRRGRPARNPFADIPEVEAELYRRAQRLVELCNHPSDENQKKDFVLQYANHPPLRLGKTTVWAILYLYYDRKYAINNLQYFVNGLREHISDKSLIGDRTTIKKVCAIYEGRKAYLHEALASISQKDGEEENHKLNENYQYVIKLWESLEQDAAI